MFFTVHGSYRNSGQQAATLGPLDQASFANVKAPRVCVQGCCFA